MGIDDSQGAARPRHAILGDDLLVAAGQGRPGETLVGAA